MSSVQDRVLARIRAKGRGAVFVPRDFLHLGSRAAVDQALSRLARDGTVRRLRRGLYDLPQLHTRLGPLSPSLDRVAAAIARSTGSKILPFGARAANALGLSTQVPARLVYLTDGPSRTVKIGNQAIDFRHAAPRKLAGAGTAAGTVIQALQYLGSDALSDDVIAALRVRLSPSDRSAVARHIKHVPARMKPILSQIAEAA